MPPNSPRSPRSRTTVLALVVLLLGAAILTTLVMQPRSDEGRVANVAERSPVKIEPAAEARIVTISGGIIRFEAPTASQLREYAPLLEEEMLRCPADLMQCADLQAIVLCRELAFNDQKRAAVPDFGRSMLYVDVERGGYDARYQRLAFHHEFYHLIDYQDDGVVYDDPAWRKLNPPGFGYGRGGASVQHDTGFSRIAATPDGFASLYATTAVEEDKAEIYAYLMVEATMLCDRARRDAILQSKLDRMNVLLKTFCPNGYAKLPFRHD